MNTNYEKDFVPYEQALALKELGFDEPCFGYYSNEKLICSNHTNNMMQRFRYAAPTFSQVFRWFRDKHKLSSHIATYWQHDWSNYSYQYYFVEDKIEWNGIEHYKTYEEAELACLKKLIEIVKQQNI
jgi:hypothetical protein